MRCLHLAAGRAGVAAAVIPALVLAACSSSGGTPTPTSSSVSSTTTKTPTPTPTKGGLPSGVTQGPLPSSVANNVTKRRSVVITKCAQTADGWGATGTATNSGSSKATFHITVFFTTTSATVLSFARTTVVVKKGARKNWTTAAKFKTPKTMLCVLRGVG